MNPPSAVAGSLATSAPEPSLALPGTRLVARSCEVPAASPELFLALGLAGDAGFWDARALGDPDALAQAGVVWSVPVTSDVSSEAFVEAGRLAAQTIDRLDVPALRAFAAVPFDGERGFLRIPRFAYAVSGDVGRLIVVGDPHVHDVESELAALRRSWEVASARSAPPAARSVADGLATELLDDGRSAYARLVAAALGAIAEGTFEKIVTARKLELGLAHAPALDALVSALPRSRVARFLVAQGAETFFGATPETLVRLADGTARADALAGSRPAPRGAAADDPLVASALAEELLRSDKDRREHELVVAFVRRALLGLGELGEVAAPTLVRLPNVWH